MNINATLNLIPVKTIKQPAIVVERKAIARFRQYHRPHKNMMAHLEYTRNDVPRNYGPYGEASQDAMAKGTIIDIFV